RRRNLSSGSHRANTSKTTRSVTAHAASARYIPRWWAGAGNASRRRYHGTSTATHATSGTTSSHARTANTTAAQPNSANASAVQAIATPRLARTRSEEHTSELQSRGHLVCRLLLEK